MDVTTREIVGDLVFISQKNRNTREILHIKVKQSLRLP